MNRALRAPRIVWEVNSIASTRVNERSLHIVGANPLRIKPYYTEALFQVICTQKKVGTQRLDAVEILGSIDGVNFPAAASTATEPPLSSCYVDLAKLESLPRSVEFSISDGASSSNLIRFGPPLPEWIMLQYSASGPVGRPKLAFHVWGAFMGDPPYGVE